MIRLRLIACVTRNSLRHAGTLAAQSTKSAYKPPKTAWGDPDLQGVWPGNMGVPMQRPANFGDRATLTEDEFAKKGAAGETAGHRRIRESTAASDLKSGNRTAFPIGRSAVSRQARRR